MSQQAKGLMTTRNFLLAGIMVALLVGVVAVFLASGDPDGLESTALVVQGQKTLTGDTPENAEIDEGHLGGTSPYSSPMPGYSLGEAPGSYGGILAIVAGTLLAFLAAFGIAKAMKILSQREGIARDRKP